MIGELAAIIQKHKRQKAIEGAAKEFCCEFPSLAREIIDHADRFNNPCGTEAIYPFAVMYFRGTFHRIMQEGP